MLMRQPIKFLVNQPMVIGYDQPLFNSNSHPGPIQYIFHEKCNVLKLSAVENIMITLAKTKL
jgi:hypothetical protein